MGGHKDVDSDGDTKEGAAKDGEDKSDDDEDEEWRHWWQHHQQQYVPWNIFFYLQPHHTILQLFVLT